MRNPLLRFRVALLVPLFLTSCGSDVESPKPILVRGHVLSSSGTPIPVARVSALDASDQPIAATVTTDLNGAYEIDASSARDQSIKLRASAARAWASNPS